MPTLHHGPGDDDEPLGGGSGAGDPMVEDVDDENIGGRANGFGIDEQEFGYDEELDIGRIGENRAHLDDNYYEEDFDDHPDRGVSGKWTAVDPTIVSLTVNGAKRQQYKLCQKELEQVKAQCKKVFGKENPTKHDIMNYFYGPRSGLFLLFQQRLGWDNRMFLKFMATNCRLAHTKSKASHLYSSDFPTDTSNLMERAEFYRCWRQIAEEGVPTSTSIGATSQILFWEEVETEVNKLFRELFIVGRSGKMIFLTDDDKFHYESHPKKNKLFNVKIMKHVRDNRWGMVMDVLCIPSLLFPTDIRTHRKGSKQIDITKMQLFGSAFGNDPNQVVDLSNIHKFLDRGFSFEQSHQDVLGPSKCDVTNTSARNLSLAFNFGQKPSKDDNRIYLEEGGIRSLRLMEKKAHGRMIVNGAFNTGTTVVLFQSTVYRKVKIDLITTTEKWGKLWNDDRERLKEIGFELEVSAAALKAAQEEIHKKYRHLFFSTAITQVTITSNLQEWHLGRSFSATSKQTMAMLTVLKKHFRDIDNTDLQQVFGFMYSGYSLVDRQTEKSRHEAAATAAENSIGDEPLTFVSERSVEELMTLGSDDELTAEEKARRDLHMLRIGAWDSATVFIETVLNSATATTEYLKEFLRQVRSSSIPSNPESLRKRCVKYAEAPDEEREFVLRGKEDLRRIYEHKHGKPATTSWQPKKLIEKIIEEVDTSTAAAGEGYEQDLMNAIVANMKLTRLSNAAKENCAKGHDMEPVLAEQLLELSKSGDIPYNVEEISSVGLVQKDNEPHVKTSVDRIVGIKKDGEQKLYLLELKTRVTQDKVQKEQDRTDKLRSRGLMTEDAIFVEMDSDSPHSHLGIHTPDERLQVLHHAYVYSQSSCFHAVGDTKELISVCKMNFPQELLESYGKVLGTLYDDGLGIFYRPDPNGDGKLVANDTEMKRIERAVEKNKDTFKEGMSRFDFNRRLWVKATAPGNLPLPPTRQILPTALSTWNINKPTGDMITQMLWEYNYEAPHKNAQGALVKRLAHQYPMYTAHRLIQLFSCNRPLSSFGSLLSFRDHTRRRNTFWHSIRHQESILCSMAAQYDPERPIALAPAPVAAGQIVATPNNTRPWPGVFPTSGRSPKKFRSAFYENQGNSHLYEYQRRWHCPGLVQLVCNERGVVVKGKRCAQCGKCDASWYCPVCKVYLCNSTPNATRRNGEPIPLMAAATGEVDANNQPVFIYARFTCSDLWHAIPRQQYYSAAASMSQPIHTNSVVQFDQNLHNNTVSNLSFEDATDTTTGGDTTTLGDTDVDDGTSP